MRWHFGALVLPVVLAASAAAIPPPPGPVVPVVPAPILPPVPGPLPQCIVTFDQNTTERWAHVQGGWRGGDGDFSVPLSGKRTLWLFGDSIVDRPGRHGYAFVRNAAVLQDRDGSLVTTAATAAGQNTVGFDDPPDQRWFWPGAGFTLGSQLWLFESEMRKIGPGFWGFQYVRSWLFQMQLRGTRLTELRRVPLPADGVIWGAAVLKDGPWLDVFGVHDLRTTKRPVVARVSRSDLLGPWIYWNGTSWTREAISHADWHGSVASEFSVVRAHGGIALVTAGRGLTATVHEYSARSVTGPWVDHGTMYKPRVPPGTFAYNPLVHSLPDGAFLLSYNLASLDANHRVPATPDAMRPRFAQIRGCI